MDDMTTTTPAVAEASTDDDFRKDVDAIIQRGQRSRPGGVATLVVSLITACLLWSAFTPLDWGPVAWFALVPLLLLIRIEKPTSRMYLAVYGGGAVYWLITLQWMRLGDPTMYIAWLAMTLYLACYWPLFIAVSRVAVHRLKAPLVIVVPVFWTGLEYLRAHLFSGFSWYYLGHTQHNWVEIIQISDLVGAYAVTFIVAATNAALAQALPISLCRRLVWNDEFASLQQSATSSRRWQGVAFAVLLVLLSLGYGYSRRAGDFQVGPRVSLIQGNFTATARDDSADWNQIINTHRHLTTITVPSQPDLIVWPEAMYRYPLFEHDAGLTDDQLRELNPNLKPEYWRSRETQKRLAMMANETNAALCIGASVFVAHAETYDVYNSAIFVKPDQGIVDRYDKLHRVPFGEYIPLQQWMPFLQWFTPYRGSFGIAAGEGVHVFEHKDWKFLPLICFEDTPPHLVRHMVAAAQGVDCLVNMTNDGWFHGSSELDQHLITASFRCIETRTPMVRAVNTGISAIIDGDGVIRNPDEFFDLDAQLAGKPPRKSIRDPRTGRFHRQLNCALVSDVPLDDRDSLYVAGGDWFPLLCLIAFIAILLQGLSAQVFRNTPPPADPTPVP